MFQLEIIIWDEGPVPFYENVLQEFITPMEKKLNNILSVVDIDLRAKNSIKGGN